MAGYLKVEIIEEESGAHPDKGLKMAKDGAVKKTFQFSQHIENLKTTVSGHLKSVSKTEPKVFSNVQKR